MANKIISKYTKHKLSRKKYTDAILNSTADRKIIISGPGTGKSFLFQEICKRNIEQGKNKNLTLSFIIELVDDLKKDLYQLSEVKTLHGFARSRIRRDNEIFVKLEDIIESDYKIAKGKNIDFKNIFCNLIKDKDSLAFYSNRRKYYNFFSPNCSVYTVLLIFSNDENEIPQYSQILIDEFQDFNKLESKLIDFLSKKNPILIVGDDDQSLYGFKHANPNDIRTKHKSVDYKTFDLPYCSRCTKAIINAFDNVINRAQSEGYLIDRIPKLFKYFPSEEKDVVCNENEKIFFKRSVFKKGLVAYNIDKEIREIFDPRSDQLQTVLIVCPTNPQIEDLEKALIKRGFKNIDASQKKKENILIEGFNLLLKNGKCNLGWRIVYQYICEKEQKEKKFKKVLDKSLSTDDEFIDLVDNQAKKYIKKIIAILRKIQKGKSITDDESNKIFDCLGINPFEIAAKNLQGELEQSDIKKNMYKNTPIKITTILKSKGLTTDYSFLVYFDDKYLLERDQDKEFVVTDSSINKFLVALTRAKKRTYIFTSENKVPTFVEWIGSQFYDEILN